MKNYSKNQSVKKYIDEYFWRKWRRVECYSFVSYYQNVSVFDKLASKKSFR